MNILDLPDCMLEQIFEYMSYDEISRKRLVCKRIDKVCHRLLNRGFSKIIKRHNTNLKRIKSLLPRRESERRVHPLARHADILTCIETRISMLSMTYSKYMELNLCCFIPGKVIDEVIKILQLIETTTKPLRAHEVLQELRDISSMAIEHFDEKIAHLLKKNFVDMSSQRQAGPAIVGVGPSIDDSLSISGQSSTSNIGALVIGNSVTRNGSVACPCPEARSNRILIHRIQQRYKAAIKKFNRVIQVQNKHMRRLRENAVIMSEMNSQIVELKRRVEEADAKNREISANISQITGEPCTNAAAASGERTIRTIKPRTATIILKRRITESAISPAYEDCDISNMKKAKLD